MWYKTLYGLHMQAVCGLNFVAAIGSQIGIYSIVM